MQGLAEHGAFVLAVVCLVAAGWRVAAASGASGLLRPIAAAVAATAAVVLETLALGVVSLSGSAPALLAAAVVTWAAVRSALPAGRPALGAELGAWWRSAGPVTRAATGAAAMLTLGWIGWQMRHPYLGFDSLIYHLPLPVDYARTGRAAALLPVLDLLPVENYPVTNEVAISWALGLSGSWVVASVWNPVLMVLLVGAGGVGLCELGVPARTAWLAVAALATLPVTVIGLNSGPATDLAALTWLVVASALAAASRSSPRLLGLAVVAAGLSFGTKTTGSVVLLAVVGAAGWAARASLRTVARPLALGVIAAVGVGGIWSIRNTVLHGSPLWPLLATSFGDPAPLALDPIRASFLSHPATMVDAYGSDYLGLLGGGLVLLAAGIAAPLLGRSRPSALAGLLVLVTGLAWSVAPYTGGTSDVSVAAGAVRYLLPCMGVGGVALALAARDSGPRARVAIDVALGLAVAYSLLRVGRLGFPYVPGAGTVVVLVALGALAGLAGQPRGPGVRLSRAAGLAGAVVAGALAAVLLNAGAEGYVGRHGGVGVGDGPLLETALARPGWVAGSFPIAMGPAVNAMLAGDRLNHPIELLPGQAPCAEVRRGRREGWVVLVPTPGPGYGHLADCLRPEAPAFSSDGYVLYADRVR